MRDKRTRRGKRLPAARAQEAATRRSAALGAGAAALAANTAPPDLLPGASPAPAPSAGSVRGVTRASIVVARRWLSRHDWTLWALLGVTLLALIPRLYGINWDANNHLHPD
ncbi:MAG: hypothetical protein ACRDHP_10490, partial [Ktedonobacterales bacterium]